MGIKLSDVAQAAGVSIKTVSNVVNGYPFVSDSTRSRVQGAIAELGYRPNLSARHLRSGRSGLVALSLPELAPYFAELAEHVISAGEQHGLTVLVDRTGGERGHEQVVAAGTRNHVTDGTIASPLSMTAADVESLRHEHPIVLLGERLYGARVDHVAVDSIAAAREVTEHLIAIGRRVIAAIGTSDQTVGTAALRVLGYEQALTAAGLQVRADLRRPVERYHRRDGYAATRRLLQARPDVDAIFCFNDLLAFGALRALREGGRRVPDDVAVAGFDDVDECAYSNPPLTSVSPDKRAIAQSAVQLLVNRIDRTAPDAAQEVFPPYRLVTRASTVGDESVPR